MKHGFIIGSMHFIGQSTMVNAIYESESGKPIMRWVLGGVGEVWSYVAPRRAVRSANSRSRQKTFAESTIKNIWGGLTLELT